MSASPRPVPLRPLLAALVLLAAIGVALPPSKAAAALPGTVPALSWGIPNADKEREADFLAASGSRWVRLHVQWRDVQPRRGFYDPYWLRQYGHAIRLAHQAGQRVLVMTYNAPAWASGSPARNVPRHARTFGDYIGGLARRLGPGVDAYEIWNEQNTRRFWSTGSDPAAYAKLLRIAYPAVKRANPNAQVVFGGLSTNDYGYLEGAYAAGAKGSFDVMATHPYPYCGATSPRATRTAVNGRMSRDSFLAYREVRATMLAHDDPRPIWMTEFGWTTSSRRCEPGAGFYQGGVSEGEQARYLTTAFELLERDPYVQVAMWYALRNHPGLGDRDTAEARYGLLRSDFRPRPSFCAFRRYARPSALPDLCPLLVPLG